MSSQLLTHRFYIELLTYVTIDEQVLTRADNASESDEEPKYNTKKVVLESPPHDLGSQRRSISRLKTRLASQMLVTTIPSHSDDLLVGSTGSTSEQELSFSDEKQRIRVRFISDAVYEGGMRDHRFEGDGAYLWPDGAVYKGDFLAGSVSGSGKMTFPDLSYYTGAFRNGQMHGRGVYHPVDMSTLYSGAWRNSLPEGIGRLYFKKSDYYEGEFLNGRMHGSGVRRYTSGAVYTGSWIKGRQHGNGVMLFRNRDCYQGEWVDGAPCGDGVYTWATRMVPGMTCGMLHQYVGHFADGGLRDGFGVQMLGMEGSRLASQFSANHKHGAGILVCGDGTTIERTPLFVHDNTTSMMVNEGSKSPVGMRRAMSNVKMRSFAAASYMRSHRMQQMFPMVTPVMTYQPVSIPMHANASGVHIRYHVQQMLHSDNHQKIANETRLMSRALALHLVYLRHLYTMYATLNSLAQCCPSEEEKPLMNRLHLWQFLRDMNIHKYNLSLYAVDEGMLNIPNNHLETEHDPFEAIFFWQFLHCLLLLTRSVRLPGESGLWAYHRRFAQFLELIVRPNAGRFAGRCLFQFRDLLPIRSVHHLFLEIPQPITARSLFNRVCVQHEWAKCLAGCPKRILIDPSPHRHYVLSGSMHLYLPVHGKEVWEAQDQQVVHSVDPFLCDLSVFRQMGPEVVMRCISDICPMVADDGAVVQCDYPIVFLEFYEILINLAEQLKLQKAEETDF